MSGDQPPLGAPFSQAYLRPSAPMKDSKRFRNRLSAYVINNSDIASEVWAFDLVELVTFLEVRTGADHLHKPDDACHKIDDLIKDGGLQDVLDTITHISRYIERKVARGRRYAEFMMIWRSFIEDLFESENLGYSLDEKYGVRYKIDEEFEQVRLASIAHLGSPRYQAVLKEFEDAYRALEANPPDTKLAVRSTFEAVETLFKLMVGRKAPSLGSTEIKRFLLPIIDRLYASDRFAANAVRQLVDGLAEWTDGLHAYRHGQAVTEPSPPPMEAAVAVLQTGSAYIRLLVELDRKLQSEATEGA